MRGIEFSRGQSLVDLAIIIGVVGLVFIGMQTYIKRGIQGKVKDLTDYIVSDQQAVEKDAVDRQNAVTLNSTMTSEEFKGGGRKLTGIEDSTTTYNQAGP
ncbi:MAG: hypothetical protein Q7S42_03345 [Candidatus Omnitrophota bacterium]|nr:hypothetical protein [Candidatus Omnitrophota bacterium]